MDTKVLHFPVLIEEVVANMDAVRDLRSPPLYLDCTFGMGGHTRAILENISGSRVVALDRDLETLNVAKGSFEDFGSRVFLINSDFRNVSFFLKSDLVEFSGIVVDLGISSFQLENPERGFSFLRCGPLDMRIDRRGRLRVDDVVNRFSFDSLREIIRGYGEERWAHRIAKAIVSARKKSRIRTTWELAKIVEKSVPFSSNKRLIHPATKTFQALRIFVNRELEDLKEGIKNLINFLLMGGRICVISFHSLEDREIKHAFVEAASEGRGRILTKKPIRAGMREVSENRSARSAKMRVFERVSLGDNAN